MEWTADSLERDSERSLYEQLRDRIREHLGHLHVGAQVPTEAELTEQFAVGRATVRKALQHLVDEGVLVRRRGKGTFIAHSVPKIVHAIDNVAAFMDTFQKNGENVFTKLIDFGWLQSAQLPDKLQAWRYPLLQFHRLYISGGIPHALTRVLMPHDVGRDVTSADVEVHRLYHVLRGKLGLDLACSEFLVSCKQPSLKVCQLLDLSPSTFLLVLDRITRDKKGCPVEMTTHYLRPDVYQLSVKIKGE